MRRKPLLLDVLLVVRDLLSIAGQLRLKYGNFEPREAMIGALNNDHLMMWLNDNYCVN